MPSTTELVTPAHLLCGVCLECYTDPVTLLCGHSFCSFCLSNWLTRELVCPTCRADCERTLPSINIALRDAANEAGGGRGERRSAAARVAAGGIVVGRAAALLLRSKLEDLSTGRNPVSNEDLELGAGALVEESGFGTIEDFLLCLRGLWLCAFGSSHCKAETMLTLVKRSSEAFFSALGLLAISVFVVLHVVAASYWPNVVFVAAPVELALVAYTAQARGAGAPLANKSFAENMLSLAIVLATNVVAWSPTALAICWFPVPYLLLWAVLHAVFFITTGVSFLIVDRVQAQQPLADVLGYDEEHNYPAYYVIFCALSCVIDLLWTFRLWPTVIMAGASAFVFSSPRDRHPKQELPELVLKIAALVVALSVEATGLVSGFLQHLASSAAPTVLLCLGVCAVYLAAVGATWLWTGAYLLRRRAPLPGGRVSYKDAAGLAVALTVALLHFLTIPSSSPWEDRLLLAIKSVMAYVAFTEVPFADPVTRRADARARSFALWGTAAGLLMTAGLTARAHL